jgi:hypothetical protein
MVVAAAVHREQGPLSQKGGFELPLTNLALAVALMSSGTGFLRLSPRLSKSLTRVSILAGVALIAGSLVQLLRAKPSPTVTPDAASVDASSEPV